MTTQVNPQKVLFAKCVINCWSVFWPSVNGSTNPIRTQGGPIHIPGTLMSHSHALRDQNAGWWPGTETRAFNVYSCTMEDRKCVSSPALFPGLPTVQYLVSNPSPTIPSAHIQYQCSHQNYRAQIISHDHSRPSVRDQTLKSIFNQTLRLYKVLKLSQKCCVI